jgi:hypothetical protein
MKQKSKKRSKPDEGILENPVIIKIDKKRDISKQCDCCETKGWIGIRHIESECFTKKREQKSAKKSKAHEGIDDNEDEEICVGAIKVRLAIPGNHRNEYQYDTSTTHHTTNKLYRISDIKEINLEVEEHDGKKSICMKQGTLILKHNGCKIHLKETLYDPTYSNLISSQRISKNLCLEVNTKNRTAQLKIGQNIIYKMTRDIRGGLWIKPEDRNTKIKMSEVSELHERYEHISFDTLKSLLECPKFYMRPQCEASEKGKATKPPVKNHQKTAPKIRTTQLLERLYADLVGPIKPITLGCQFKYLLITINNFSRYVVTKALKTKSDTTNALIEIIDAFENVCNHLQNGRKGTLRVWRVQADWGGEFRNDRLAEEFQQRGI